MIRLTFRHALHEIFTETLRRNFPLEERAEQIEKLNISANRFRSTMKGRQTSFVQAKLKFSAKRVADTRAECLICRCRQWQTIREWRDATSRRGEMVFLCSLMTAIKQSLWRGLSGVFRSNGGRRSARAEKYKKMICEQTFLSRELLLSFARQAEENSEFYVSAAHIIISQSNHPTTIR